MTALISRSTLSHTLVLQGHYSLLLRGSAAGQQLFLFPLLSVSLSSLFQHFSQEILNENNLTSEISFGNKGGFNQWVLSSSYICLAEATNETVCGSIPNSSQSTLVQDTHLRVAFDHLILIMPSQCVCMLNVSKDAYMIHKKNVHVSQWIKYVFKSGLKVPF